MERAGHVHIEAGAVVEYAAGLVRAAADEAPAETPADRDPEAAAAFAICMNAIKFGSGWWPTIRKRPGLSGYGTMAAGVRDRFEAEGPWSAEELAAIEAEELLPHGSPQEVELRAAAVHAVELLTAATKGGLSPAQIDGALWNRGADRRYKSLPRPRSRNTAY